MLIKIPSKDYGHVEFTIINTDHIEAIGYVHDKETKECRLVIHTGTRNFYMDHDFDINKLAEFVPIIDIETGENIYKSRY